MRQVFSIAAKKTSMNTYIDSIPGDGRTRCILTNTSAQAPLWLNVTYCASRRQRHNKRASHTTVAA